MAESKVWLSERVGNKRKCHFQNHISTVLPLSSGFVSCSTLNGAHGEVTGSDDVRGLVSGGGGGRGSGGGGGRGYGKHEHDESKRAHKEAKNHQHSKKLNIPLAPTHPLVPKIGGVCCGGGIGGGGDGDSDDDVSDVGTVGDPVLILEAPDMPNILYPMEDLMTVEEGKVRINGVGLQIISEISKQSKIGSYASAYNDNNRQLIESDCKLRKQIRVQELIDTTLAEEDAQRAYAKSELEVRTRKMFGDEGLHHTSNRATFLQKSISIADSEVALQVKGDKARITHLRTATEVTEAQRASHIADRKLDGLAREERQEDLESRIKLAELSSRIDQLDVEERIGALKSQGTILELTLANRKVADELEELDAEEETPVKGVFFTQPDNTFWDRIDPDGDNDEFGADVGVPYFVRHHPRGINYTALAILSLSVVAGVTAASVPVLGHSVLFVESLRTLSALNAGRYVGTTGISGLSMYSNLASPEMDRTGVSEIVNYTNMNRFSPTISMMILHARLSSCNLGVFSTDDEFTEKWLASNKYTHNIDRIINVRLYNHLYRKYSGGLVSLEQLNNIKNYSMNSPECAGLGRHLIDATCEVVHQALDFTKFRCSFGVGVADRNVARFSFE